MLKYCLSNILILLQVYFEGMNSYMIMVKNQFGQETIDFDDETSASRVGARIRKIRTELGLSQTELGEMVGLTADRIQKYENGARKPKMDLLKSIATSLGVSPLALTDPNTTSYIGAVYALFEMEEMFNVKIEMEPTNRFSKLCVSIEPGNPLYSYLKEWYDVYSQTESKLELASSDNEKKEIIKEYHKWQWTYPQGIIAKSEKGLQKALIKKKIEELQAIYANMDETGDL